MCLPTAYQSDQSFTIFEQGTSFAAIMKTPLLLTVAQAAKLKNVSRSAIYQAIQSGRLSHQVVLGHIGIEESVINAWSPTGHRAGRPKGIPVSEEVKKRISQAQKKNWDTGKRKKRKGLKQGGHTH